MSVILVVFARAAWLLVSSMGATIDLLCNTLIFEQLFYFLVVMRFKHLLLFTKVYLLTLESTDVNLICYVTLIAVTFQSIFSMLTVVVKQIYLYLSWKRLQCLSLLWNTKEILSSVLTLWAYIFLTSLFISI